MGQEIFDQIQAALTRLDQYFSSVKKLDGYYSLQRVEDNVIAGFDSLKREEIAAKNVGGFIRSEAPPYIAKMSKGFEQLGFATQIIDQLRSANDWRMDDLVLSDLRPDEPYPYNRPKLVVSIPSTQESADKINSFLQKQVEHDITVHLKDSFEEAGRMANNWLGEDQGKKITRKVVQGLTANPT